MPNLQRVRDLIELEVFLFQGVPERPNPVYGRDSYASVHSRTSRANVEHCQDETQRSPVGHMLQRISVDFQSGEITFSSFIPSDAS
jgi:hypothetical protein